MRKHIKQHETKYALTIHIHTPNNSMELWMELSDLVTEKPA